MNPVGSALFLRSDRVNLRAWLDFRGNQEVRRAVDALSNSAFTTQTDEELENEIGKDLLVEPLHVEVDRAERNVVEVPVTIEDPFGRGPIKRMGLRALKRIPFSGNPELWQLMPSSYGTQLPHGQITGDNLIVGVDLQDSEADRAPACLEQQIATVNVYLHRQAADIAAFNDSLPSRIRPQLQQRRALLAKASDLLNRL
jgi:hypothetical protein